MNIKRCINYNEELLLKLVKKCYKKELLDKVIDIYEDYKSIKSYDKNAIYKDNIEIIYNKYKNILDNLQ